MAGLRAAIAAVFVLAVTAQGGGLALRADGQWSAPQCAAFDLQLECPASCAHGCELDITDASNTRSRFQLLESGMLVGSSPHYANPLLPPQPDVDARINFPAFTEAAQDFSSAIFLVDSGSHTIQVEGSSQLSADGQVLKEPRMRAPQACAYLRAQCAAPHAGLLEEDHLEAADMATPTTDSSEISLASWWGGKHERERMLAAYSPGEQLILSPTPGDDSNTVLDVQVTGDPSDPTAFAQVSLAPNNTVNGTSWLVTSQLSNSDSSNSTRRLLAASTVIGPFASSNFAPSHPDDLSYTYNEMVNGNNFYTAQWGSYFPLDTTKNWQFLVTVTFFDTATNKVSTGTATDVSNGVVLNVPFPPPPSSPTINKAPDLPKSSPPPAHKSPSPLPKQSPPVKHSPPVKQSPPPHKASPSPSPKPSPSPPPKHSPSPKPSPSPPPKRSPSPIVKLSPPVKKLSPPPPLRNNDCFLFNSTVYPGKAPFVPFLTVHSPSTCSCYFLCKNNAKCTGRRFCQTIPKDGFEVLGQCATSLPVARDSKSDITSACA